MLLKYSTVIIVYCDSENVPCSFERESIVSTKAKINRLNYDPADFFLSNLI